MRPAAGSGAPRATRRSGCATPKTRPPPPARPGPPRAQPRAVVVDAGQGGRVDLPAALAALAARGLTRILCEGGPTLAAALVRAGLVDRIALFTGGALIGAEGAPALGPLGLVSLADALRPRRTGIEAVGPDTLTLWSLD